jgi:hypothetical protein
MADNSLNESFTCINYIKKEIHFLEVKKIYLSQIKLLINKMLYGYDNDQSNKNNHLYTINYFIEQIRELNEKSILLLEKINKRVKKSNFI